MVYNFSAGPGMLPVEVMKQAQEEFLDWHGTGTSIMEVSHRGQHFISVAEKSVQLVKELLSVPDNYQVLFLHGGAQSQFSMVPMNLMASSQHASYFDTGHWSHLAVNEAKRYGHVDLVTDSRVNDYTAIEQASTWNQVDKSSSYVYYCDNETVQGIEFQHPPLLEGAPLVCDMSSNILSRAFDVNRLGVFFACAQKNMGQAGITLCVIRDDLLQREPFEFTPMLYRYVDHVKSQSMRNTPATYAWYMASLVLQWVKDEGGVEEMNRRALVKSGKLYEYIDASGFYINDINHCDRSRLNVVFRCHDPSLNDAFVLQAQSQGMPGLKGHRVVGGMRASLYNAMPEAGVDQLIAFMKTFEQQYG